MIIINSIIIGFWIGVLAGVIGTILFYRKKIVSGIFAIFILGGGAFGGAFIGFLIGIFRSAVSQNNKGQKTFLETLHPSSLLDGNLTTITLYIILLLIVINILSSPIYIILNRIKEKELARQKDEVISSIWQKIQEKTIQIEDKNKIADYINTKENLVKLFEAQFSGYNFIDFYKKPENIEQYVEDLILYDKDTAYAYMQYLLYNQGEHFLKKAAKGGHLKAINTLKEV